MPYKIWNTMLDHTRRFEQRRAPKMQEAPVIAGRRLRIRTSMILTDFEFSTNRATIELCKKHGVLDWKQLDEQVPVNQETPSDAPPPPQEPVTDPVPAEPPAVVEVAPVVEPVAEPLVEQPKSEEPSPALVDVAAPEAEESIVDPPAPAVEAQVEEKEEAPLAETPPAPVGAAPQLKSPFKSKKKQS